MGCATGKATRPLARRGYRITCVELGTELAAVARQNLTGLEVEVVQAAFEPVHHALAKKPVPRQHPGHHHPKHHIQPRRVEVTAFHLRQQRRLIDEGPELH